jgi:oxygen-independent coproporphyrinogen-3 oxidase
VRWWNHAGLDAWAAPLAEARSPTAGHEVLDDEQRSLERVLLGVRLAEGLRTEAVPRPTAVAGLVDDGLVDVAGDRVVLTPRGRLLADTVVRALTIG